MRLGIFGGTFDPVHYGHLLVAESCREQLRLDEVWFLPAAVPPHKQQRELTPGSQRIEMLELAIGGHAAFRVCRYEIDRGGVSYTVDTLAHFRQEHADAEMFFLLGADSLRDLPGWREPVRLCELATPVVVGRVGQRARSGSRRISDGCPRSFRRATRPDPRAPRRDAADRAQQQRHSPTRGRRARASATARREPWKSSSGRSSYTGNSTKADFSPDCSRTQAALRRLFSPCYFRRDRRLVGVGGSQGLEHWSSCSAGDSARSMNNQRRPLSSQAAARCRRTSPDGR